MSGSGSAPSSGRAPVRLTARGRPVFERRQTATTDCDGHAVDLTPLPLPRPQSDMPMNLTCPIGYSWSDVANSRRGDAMGEAD
jgi:hypothetical protein